MEGFELVVCFDVFEANRSCELSGSSSEELWGI
jgi:hypothetical protein